MLSGSSSPFVKMTSLGRNPQLPYFAIAADTFWAAGAYRNGSWQNDTGTFNVVILCDDVGLWARVGLRHLKFPKFAAELSRSQYIKPVVFI